ncbi:MAG: hypothetical protein ABSH31_18810 [Bryobacteraceae bacterium]
MKAALILAAGCMLFCAVLEGAEREFNDIVRAVSDELHARPLRIPFFGLVNFATSVAHPAGVKHIDLAVFEDLDLDAHAARNITEAIQRLDRGWKPFVQVRSRNHGREESVLVYIRDAGSDCKLLVASVETEEVTVVELKLDPASLEVWLNGDRGVRSLRPLPKSSCDKCVDGEFAGTENQNDQRSQ